MKPEIRGVTWAIVGLIAAQVFGCAELEVDGGIGSGSPVTATHAEQSCRRTTGALRVMTFNAALAPEFEPLSPERAPKVIDAVATASRDLDIACVQEFWKEEHFQALRSRLSELPHVVRGTPRVGSGECSTSELGPLVSCLSQHCPTTGDTVACATSACAAEVSSLSGGCLGCVINNLTDIPKCQGSSGALADPAIFDGAQDVGLLSRWPILQRHVTELASYFVRASILHARIVVPGFGPVDAYCTHLGSPLGIVPYAGDFGSWEGEHEEQVREVLHFVRRTSRGTHPTVLLGDFNMGPAVGSNVQINDDHYRQVINAGFDDAYLTKNAQPLCTNCAGTTFRDSDAQNTIVDLVFSRALPLRDIRRERLFVDAVDLGPGLPTFNLSDHVGVKVTFAR